MIVLWGWEGGESARVYPDGYLSFVPVEGGMTGKASLNATFTPKIKQQPLESLIINVKGTDNKADIYFSADAPGYWKASGKIHWIMETEEIAALSFEADAELWYEALGIRREQIEMLPTVFPLAKKMISDELSKATGGNLTLIRLELTKFDLTDTTARLSIEGEIKGNFEKAMRYYLSRYYPKPEVAPPEALYEELRAIKYAKLKSFELNIEFSREKALLKCEFESFTEGDVDKQLNAMKDVYVKYIRQLVPNQPEEFYRVVENVGKVEFSISNLYTRFSYRLLEDEEVFAFEGENLAFKPPVELKPGEFSMSEFFAMLEKVPPEPMENVSLKIEAGSTQDIEVRSPLPPERAMWGELDFAKMKAARFELRSNPTGIADYREHIKEAIIKGERRVLHCYVNSTVRDIRPEADKIEFEVEGPEGTIGAINASIPKEIVEEITVFVDNKIVTPKISVNATHYFVYVSYVHSVRTITIKLMPVYTLAISADKIEGNVGETFVFSGTLMKEGVPVKDALVTLYKDTEVVAQVRTDDYGKWRAEWSTERAGDFNFHAKYDEISSETISVKVLPPPVPPLLLYVIIAIVAIVIIVGVVLYLRKGRLAFPPTV